MLVLDASAAVQLALRAGFERLAGRDAHAPALLWSESASALRQLAWRGTVDEEHALVALRRLAEAPIARETGPELQLAAFHTAGQLGWAKTYDAEYIALAAQLGCPLLTLDGRLARTASRLIDVLGPEEV